MGITALKSSNNPINAKNAAGKICTWIPETKKLWFEWPRANKPAAKTREENPVINSVRFISAPFDAFLDLFFRFSHKPCKTASFIRMDFHAT